MMLSVIKNTNRPVKFWFIKNYLSPNLRYVYIVTSRDFVSGIYFYSRTSVFLFEYVQVVQTFNM